MLRREVVLVLVLSRHRVIAAGNEAVDAQAFVHRVDVSLEVVVL